MNSASRWTSVALAAALSGGFSQAQTTERVSVDSAGAQANGNSNLYSMISGDGRFVAFKSSATNLVAGDLNGLDDAFVHDRQTGTTECVSVDLAGLPGNGASALFGIAISSDGRFVAFQSEATNLIVSDLGGYRDIFVRDRQTGTTECVSVDSAGNQGNYHSRFPSISPDGRFVSFSSAASNLAPGDTNGLVDVFLRDRLNGTTVRISVDSTGAEANQQSLLSAVSADGRFVAFDSTATNLVAGDTNGVRDIFLRDVLNGTTVRVSVDAGGAQGNLDSANPCISADGRFVAFDSAASNLVPGDTNAVRDAFMRDLQTGTIERVSVDAGGVQGTGNSTYPALSADGRFVAFDSAASNLVAGDTNAFRDCFVRDRQSGTVERVSVDTAGTQGDSLSSIPSLSANGGRVAFQSYATNLVAGDTNVLYDVFLRDRGTNPGTDICQAGTGGVIVCPCSNPPANAPRGCNNSAATGGAQLTSSGTAALSHDTLVFVTNGERASATSIVLQGTAVSASGVVFGQGVRCVAGSLKRLYTKTASGGSITAPGPGDPSVSLRSAILNQPIAPGSSRWYAVYYRDPNVLGGCPSTSTFNITQTQLVPWGS
jgi:Tol biopolymer transport system component